MTESKGIRRAKNIKTCLDCGIAVDPLSIYYKKLSRCPACSSVKATKWNKSHPEARSNYARKRKYTLTKEQYQDMLSDQAGSCAICETISKLVVDHDHKCCSDDTSCGKCIRGLLCLNCNHLLWCVE